MADVSHPGPTDHQSPSGDQRQRVRTRRRLLLEAYLAAVPVAVGIAFGASLLVQSVLDVLFAIALLVLLAGSLIVPLLLVVDAQETRPTASIRRLAVASIVLPLPTLVYYFRSDPAPTPPGRFAGLAHLIIAAGIPAWLGFFAGEIVILFGEVSGTGVYLRESVVLPLGGLGVLLYAPFPFAVYADSKYVRANGRDWNPSPALRYLAMLAFYSPLALLLPVYVIYHLFRRRRALGRAGGDR